MSTFFDMPAGYLQDGGYYRWSMRTRANGVWGTVFAPARYFSVNAAESTARVTGIDVSHHQGTIDWVQVASSGVKFSYVKATEGDGADSPDPVGDFALDARFAQNAAGAVQYGLLVGVYHYARPDFLENSPEDEARWFVSKAAAYIGAGFLPPALDVENEALRVSSEYLSTWVDAWLDEVERLTGVRPIVYGSQAHLRYINQNPLGNNLWVARYSGADPQNGNPGDVSPWSANDWDLWQYTSTGSVPGIAGDVDRNVYNGSYAQLLAWIGAAVVPAPTVTAVAPFVGPTSGGNVVVISGAGFTAATEVKFDGASAISFTINSASQVTAVAPPHAAATINVTVRNSVGTSSTTTTADDYTYAEPAIESVVVNGGAVVARNSFGQAPVLANQNSVVAQLLVKFNQPVHVDAGAFDVVSLAGAVANSGAAPAAAGVVVAHEPVAATGNPTDGYAQYRLTFAPGAATNSFAGTVTLKDGLYRLDSIGSRIHAGLGSTAANRSDTFWALYGAVNEDEVVLTSPVGGGDDTLLVDGLALNDFYAAFGARADTAGPPSYDAGFDWNLDGFVDGVDLNQLYANFGTIWKF